MVRTERAGWRSRYGRIVAGVLSAAVALSPLVPLGTLSAAQAADPADFNPGNIISDQNFYDDAAMTEAQIQAFLAGKGSVLATYTNTIASRAQSVSASTGNVRCEAFTGGTSLKASTIIYRTQVACGISAKVIIVTLQKEQGLIEKATATAGALDRAMGMACPDTSPCAAWALGFGNQVYEGAKQLKTYKASQVARQPGTHTIGWHPNAACGYSTFVIENYATAALYNYTPYRPNAASLANFPKVGDACSTYGNRNFWFFYTNWFGPTSAVDPIKAINTRYAELGGASGALGAAGAQPSCTWESASCTRTYAHGVIHWIRYGTAIAVSGAMGDYYLLRGGVTSALGAPVAEGAAVTDPNGNGFAQKLANGWIHSSASGTYYTSNALMTAYSSVGWLRGYLGWPVGAESCGATGFCMQQFAGGLLDRGPTGAGEVMSPAIWNVYKATGAATGSLGYPAGLAAAVSDPKGDGFAQKFDKGWIHSSSAGTFTTSTTLMTAYSAAGWLRGYLGWPTAAEVCTAGACSQTFSGGVIYTAPGGVTGSSTRAVWDKYQALGGFTGSLGLPASSVSAVSDPKGDGFAQKFANGWIHSSSSGTFTTSTTLMTAYSAAGWLRGYLGWPTAAEVCTASSCSQTFRGGTLTR